VQQGKTLYDAGQFTQVVKVLQASAAFELREMEAAMTLSNLSLPSFNLDSGPRQNNIRKAIASASRTNLNLQTGRNISNLNDDRKLAHL